MFKRYLHIIFLIGLPVICSSQNIQLADSTNSVEINYLKKQLLTVKNDSLRVRVIQGIGFHYEVLNLDSSLKYTQMGLALAREHRYAWGEAALMIDLATILREQGKLAGSMDILLKSIEIAKANNVNFEIARANRRLSDIYMDLENFPKAIGYLLEALKIDKENHRKKSVLIDEMTLGHAYEKINKLDSASFYINTVFQEPDVFKKQYVYQVMGNIQLKKGNYNEATNFFREGLSISENDNDRLTASGICADISTLFIKLNIRDLAILYALKGFEYRSKCHLKEEPCIMVIYLQSFTILLNPQYHFDIINWLQQLKTAYLA